LLLVNPGVALSTAAVFAARTGDFGAPARFDDVPADATALGTLLATRGNDLEDAATRLAPVTGEVRAALAAQSGCLLARLSGSGATCFGLFADAAPAETAGQPAPWPRTTRIGGSNRRRCMRFKPLCGHLYAEKVTCAQSPRIPIFVPQGLAAGAVVPLLLG